MVYKIAWRHSFNSSDQYYVCFKLKIVGKEDAQTEFGTVDLLCIFSGGGFESLCRLSPPHLFLYLFIHQKKQKKQGFTSMNIEEPKSYYYYYIIISISIY